MGGVTTSDKDALWGLLAPNLTDSDGNLIPWDQWGSMAEYAARLDPDLKERVEAAIKESAWRNLIKGIAKNKATATVIVRGERRKISRYVGVPVARKDGTVVEQQKLIETLTLTEAMEVHSGLKQQIKSLGYNVEMMEKIIALCVHHQVDTVPDALAAEGVTIEALFPEY